MAQQPPQDHLRIRWMTGDLAEGRPRPPCGRTERTPSSSSYNTNPPSRLARPCPDAGDLLGQPVADRHGICSRVKGIKSNRVV
jgi:hypothetical protein